MERFRVGPVAVKVYPAKNSRHVAVFRDLTGRRIRIERPNAATAKTAAREEITKLLDGSKIELDRIEAILAPFGASMIEAARFFARAHEHSLKDSPAIERVVEEFLTVKARDVGFKDIKDLRHRLGRFAQDFSKRTIAEIDTPALNRWLDGLPLSGRTRKNYLACIVRLFRFAQGRGYLIEGTTAAQKVERPKVETPRKDVFAPEELASLFDAAERTLTPALAIAAFAGIRSEEIAPEGPEDPALEWRDIVWDERQIFIREEVSKTRGRYVPMSDNLLSWIAPWRNAQGRIFTNRRLDRAFGRIAQTAGITWKHNALRHSFGTYRMAMIKNVAQVAEEMGNSIAMVRRHYQRPMLESVASRWFAIRPAEANVIAMPSVV